MNLLLEATLSSRALVFRDAPPLWVIILVIMPVLAAFVVLFYRMGREAPMKVRVFLAGLRLLLLLFLLALLMNPAWRTQVVEKRKALTVVLVDTSASMSHKDDYATNPTLAGKLSKAAHLAGGAPLSAYSRLDLVKAVLDRPRDPFLTRLMKKNDVRLYSFGEVLSGVAALQELEAKERVTAIGAALERILDEPDIKSRPVGGLVLISDGKNTAPPLPEAAAAVAGRRKIPIYTVGVGDPKALKDVELVSVNAPSVVLADDTMVIDIRLRQRGFKERPLRLQLLQEGTPLSIADPRGSVLLKATANDQAFQIHYRPTTTGRFRWIVRAKPLPGEFDTQNNSKAIVVRVRRERIKVLYVEGLPRWEYRKLKDFLTRSQSAFETQCWLTSAMRGFPQEASPRLPSLLRFPDTREELFRYDVIIFGDVNPEDLSEDRRRTTRVLQLIRSFVDNGGGFAMIAGNRFSPRAYKDTPLEDIIPVVIDAQDFSGGSTVPEGFRVRPTDLGLLSPIMQFVPDPKRNKRIWAGRDSDLMTYRMWWFSPVRKARPGTRVLALNDSAQGPSGPYPIFVSGNYGDGPLFFSAVDETWRWYKQQGPVLFFRFWGNVVRHLARARLFQGDKRFRLVANRSRYAVGDRVTLTAYVKDRGFRPKSDPYQPLIIKAPGQDQEGEKRKQMPRIEPGVFELSFLAQKPGDYTAWIPGQSGLADTRISPVHWSVVVSDVEHRQPVLDELLLKRIAGKSGARYLLLPEVRQLLAKISSGTVEIPRRQRFVSLRDRSQRALWLFPLLFVGFLGVEWFLRKRFRLL